MTDPAKYWPGGIPEHIQCHPTPIYEGLEEEVKGWQLFLEENAVGRGPGTRDDDHFEVTQRRRLVSRWAAAPQAERDTYQAQAPVRASAAWYPRELLRDAAARPPRHHKGAEHSFCVGLLGGHSPDGEEEEEGDVGDDEGSARRRRRARDRALWAKQRLLCYDLEGRDGDGTLFGDDEVAVTVPNATAPGQGEEEEASVTPEGFLRWCHVEAAVLDAMAMTAGGGVIFLAGRPAVLFADRAALETGPWLLCALSNNGRPDATVTGRAWPYYLPTAFRLDRSAGTMLAGGDVGVARTVNMEKGLLDILDALWPRGGAPDAWLDYIERYAPGYLDCEEAGGGMAFGYDHARFRTDQELEDLPFEDDELVQNGAFESVPPYSTPEPRSIAQPRGSSRAWLDVVL